MKKIVPLPLLIIFAFVIICCQKAKKEPELSVHTRIFDSVGILTIQQQHELFKSIRDLEEKIGSQIAVVIIDTLYGEKIESYSLRKFETLKLGRERFKDGVLITVSYKDHKIRIDVGYGLERIIKDELSSRIIREEMVPKFVESKFYEGIYAGIKSIKKLIEDNKKLVGQMP